MGVKPEAKVAKQVHKSTHEEFVRRSNRLLIANAEKDGHIDMTDAQSSL